MLSLLLKVLMTDPCLSRAAPKWIECCKLSKLRPSLRRASILSLYQIHVKCMIQCVFISDVRMIHLPHNGNLHSHAAPKASQNQNFQSALAKTRSVELPSKIKNKKSSRKPQKISGKVLENGPKFSNPRGKHHWYHYIVIVKYYGCAGLPSRSAAPFISLLETPLPLFSQSRLIQPSFQTGNIFPKSWARIEDCNVSGTAVAAGRRADQRQHRLPRVALRGRESFAVCLPYSNVLLLQQSHHCPPLHFESDMPTADHTGNWN